MSSEEKYEVATYLGKKGYSIYKENLSIKDQQWLRNELLVRPYIPKSPVQPEAFPIYLESPKKIYIPRFFGIENKWISENGKFSIFINQLEEEFTLIKS